MAPKLRIPENTLDALPQSEVLNAWVYGTFLASFTVPLKEPKKILNGFILAILVIGTQFRSETQ